MNIFTNLLYHSRRTDITIIIQVHLKYYFLNINVTIDEDCMIFGL